MQDQTSRKAAPRLATAVVSTLVAIAGAPRAASPACIVQVVGGDAHTLALDADGVVWAWGLNSDGELGDGTNVNSLVAVKPLGLPRIAWIGDEQEGEEHSLALATDGTVWAWGNGFGNVPVQVSGLANVIDISGGEDQSVALRSDGTVWQWSAMSALEKVTNLGDVVQLGGGGDGPNSALKRDGTVWTWRANVTTADQVQAPWGRPLGGCIDVACGYNYFLAVDSEGDVWGGILGTIPGRVSLPDRALHVAAGEGISLALLRDGTVWSWSQAVGPTTQVPGLQDVVWIACGDLHGLAIESDGSLWAWGGNRAGQIGDGTTTDAPVPVRVKTGPPDPVPGDQGNVLRAVKRLPADALYDFAAAMAPAWRLYRDVSKLMLGQTAIAPDVTVPSYLDPGVIRDPPDLDFYRLKGLSPCTSTPGP